MCMISRKRDLTLKYGRAVAFRAFCANDLYFYFKETFTGSSLAFQIFIFGPNRGIRTDFNSSRIRK